MKAEVSTVGIIGGGQLGMFLAQACLLYTSPSPRDEL